MLKLTPPIPCRPPWWAASGHWQTILGNYLPGKSPDHPSEPFLLPLRDGDQLAGRQYPGETDVLALPLANRPGELAKLAATLAKAKVNIEYAYGTVQDSTALLVVRVNDIKTAVKALKKMAEDFKTK